MGGVYRDHVDLLLRSSDLATSRVVSQQLIVEARETLEKLKGAELRDYFEDECIASVREGGRAVRKGVAVVHTVILPDRLELLVTLPSGIERFSSRISASKLNALVDEFRSEVQNPRSDAYPSHAMELSERQNQVRAALAELSEEYRTVLVLKEMESLKYEEISEILDCPIGTVRSRLHRARVEMREKLEFLLKTEQ